MLYGSISSTTCMYHEDINCCFMMFTCGLDLSISDKEDTGVVKNVALVSRTRIIMITYWSNQRLRILRKKVTLFGKSVLLNREYLFHPRRPIAMMTNENIKMKQYWSSIEDWDYECLKMLVYVYQIVSVSQKTIRFCHS